MWASVGQHDSDRVTAICLFFFKDRHRSNCFQSPFPSRLWICYSQNATIVPSSRSKTPLQTTPSQSRHRTADQIIDDRRRQRRRLGNKRGTLQTREFRRKGSVRRRIHDIHFLQRLEDESLVRGWFGRPGLVPKHGDVAGTGGGDDTVFICQIAAVIEAREGERLCLGARVLRRQCGWC